MEKKKLKWGRGIWGWLIGLGIGIANTIFFSGENLALFVIMMMLLIISLFSIYMNRKNNGFSNAILSTLVLTIVLLSLSFFRKTIF